MCLRKQVHLGATLFNVSKPLINDGARTVCFPDPYMGQGEIAAVKKILDRGDVTTQYLGTRMAVILAP